jgi:hypothetical protein
MMQLSVLERIASNVASTLAGMTTAGGYNLTITRAKRVNQPAHLQGYIYQLSENPIEDAQIGTDEQKQPFAVVVFVIPAEDDDTPVDTYNNDIAATIKTALMSDFSRGGLAINTEITQTLYFPPVAGEFSGITLMFNVHYRNLLDKSYVAAT